MKVRNYSKILLSTTVISLFMTGAAIAAERILKVTNWAEYIGEVAGNSDDNDGVAVQTSINVKF